MKYKSGRKVEVLSQKDLPSGSWRGAQIICGNGHTYTVRYDIHPGSADETVMERVPRKAIRPSPPVELLENWAPDDIVEVFDNFSWRMATVSNILGRKCFLVRLLGSSLEFKVSKNYIRARLSWQDDKWVVIGKGSKNCEDGRQKSALKNTMNSSSQIQLTDAVLNSHAKYDSFALKNKMYVPEVKNVASRNLKRGQPYCDSPVEACTGVAQKFRVLEKEGRCCRMVDACPTALPEQVDAVASTREMLAEKYKYASFNNRTTGFSEMDVERLKTNGIVGSSLAISLEANDADSFTCSVGSCSVASNVPFESSCHFRAGLITDGNISDAESCCHLGCEEEKFLCPSKEELAAEIHRLELHAYRCTMEALHASGPLSWELETLMTNLRLSLHISNDEHLMELRNLVSSDTSIPIS